jgi:type 1 glutamine amidotransferase
MNRRELMAMAGAMAMAATGVSSGRAAAAPKRRILFFSKSSGFEHPVIKRAGDAPSFVEKILTELGSSHGFEIVSTKDGGVFTPENLAGYDAFFFYTTGDLTQPSKDGSPPMTPEGKAAFLEAVRNGKAFIGTHSATDTFHTQPDPPDRSNRYVSHGDAVDPYIAMIGGEFIKHGHQQKARLRATDLRFPGCQALGEGFEMMEEWYSLKEFRKDLHVLLVQETAGMTDPEYQRGPYPATWARMHGKGRVFYTSLGHREDVWTSEIFRSILLGGIAWAVGNVEADVSPNLEKAAPRHGELPPKPA